MPTDDLTCAVVGRWNAALQPGGLEKDERGEPASFMTGQPNHPVIAPDRHHDRHLDAEAQRIAVDEDLSCDFIREFHRRS
jgi:hypothetical protein